MFSLKPVSASTKIEVFRFMKAGRCIQRMPTYTLAGLPETFPVYDIAQGTFPIYARCQTSYCCSGLARCKLRNGLNWTGLAWIYKTWICCCLVLGGVNNLHAPITEKPLG